MNHHLTFVISLGVVGVCLTSINPLIHFSYFRTAWSLLVGLVSALVIWLVIPVIMFVALDAPFFSRWIYLVISSIYFPYSFSEFFVSIDGYKNTTLAPHLAIRLVTAFIVTTLFKYRVYRFAYGIGSDYFEDGRSEGSMDAKLNLGVVFIMNGAAIAAVSFVATFLPNAF